MLKRPIISEKTMKLAGDHVYTFEVEKEDSKPMIAKIIKDLFKVDVLSIRTYNVKGKKKWQRRARKTYQLPNVKRAVVVVKKGQIIPLFEAPKEIDPEEVMVTRGEEEPTVVKERKSLLGRTKVKVEKSATGSAPTTQRKVITGK